jgi:hypothetical protein
MIDPDNLEIKQAQDSLASHIEIDDNNDAIYLHVGAISSANLPTGSYLIAMAQTAPLKRPDELGKIVEEILNSERKVS